MNQGECIALFPGSFKPPHAAHMAAIAHLAERPDIDRIVLIIANRIRPLADGMHCIDASGAEHLLQVQIDLLGLPADRITIEFAGHQAVQHALNQVQRSPAGTRLLFCLGEQDAALKDDRFDAVATLARKHGVEAGVLVLPAWSNPVRATTMREALSRGDAGYADFAAGLSTALSDDDKQHVWRESLAAVKPLAEAVRGKVAELLPAAWQRCIADAKVTDGCTADPAFRWQESARSEVLIKYAGDTVAAGHWFRKQQQKPAQRVAVEARAIRYLRAQAPQHQLLPEIVHYDKTYRLLLTRVPAAPTLQHLLDLDRINPGITAAVGSAVRRLHSTLVPTAQFCKDVTVEEQIAATWLRGISASIARLSLSPAARGMTVAALRDSMVRKQRGVFMLPCLCDEFVITDTGAMPINLERTGTVGDPALDLSPLLSGLLAWAARTGNGIASILGFLHGYGGDSALPDLQLIRRALALAACGMASHGNASDRQCAARVLEALADNSSGEDIPGLLGQVFISDNRPPATTTALLNKQAGTALTR
ncbi:MAG: hypothetical protein H6978_06695 [Gammaproteobacteria bacterium]|nr:hypothetical protein [Gammaproteobacteria bacterium]